jgi:hypothetical protein
VINMLGGIRLNTASLTRDSTSPGEELKAVVSYVCQAMNPRHSTYDNLLYRTGAMHKAGGKTE